jgi:hypothetical protein
MLGVTHTAFCTLPDFVNFHFGISMYCHSFILF